MSARLQELIELLNTAYIVEYAYPSSTHAVTYGMGRTGCYYVSAFAGVDQARVPVSSHGYATREEAEGFADIYNDAAQRELAHEETRVNWRRHYEG